MYDYRCLSAGAAGCGFRVKAQTETELRAAIAEHARKKHNVQSLSDTLYNHMRDTPARV